MSEKNQCAISQSRLHIDDDGVNNVLDSVLEHIDGILMDTIPPNPDLVCLPPIPSSGASQQSIPTQYDESVASPNNQMISQQFYLQQSINNNMVMIHNNNNNNNDNNNESPKNKQQQIYHGQGMTMEKKTNSDEKQQQFPIQQTMKQQYETMEEEISYQFHLAQQINNNYNNNDNISQNISSQNISSQNKSFMTPSSSDNSLVSLESTNTVNTVNTATTRSSSCSQNNKDNVLFIGSSTKITQFEAINNSLKLQLKDHVFISKDCTLKLSEYIVRENWGKDQGLLYKYIDYIFRCQAFKKQIIIINNKYLIFHCGLQRRTDKQFLYGLLIPNKKYVVQKWRVSFGNIKNSFLSKSELLSKLPQSYLIEDYLPKRTIFFHSLSELLYDTTYSIQVNWEERLTTNKDRICRVLGNLAFFDSNSKFLKLTELIEAFDKSLKQTQQIAELNPRLAVPQGFIDTKHQKFRMELLLPLIIEFPKYSTNFYIFALAISKTTELESIHHNDDDIDINNNQYIGKSILTMDMAYSNARLVGYVDSIWLFYGKNNNKRYDINDFFYN